MLVVRLSSSYAIQRINAANNVAIQVVGVRHDLIERIRFGHFPGDFVVANARGETGSVHATDQKTIRVVGESVRIPIPVDGAQEQPVRLVLVAHERADFVMVPQQIARRVVDVVVVCPAERIDLVRGLVEERMEVPARDFVQRVRAGDHVGSVIVAKERFPTQRLSDARAIAGVIVGVTRFIVERVALRENAPLAIVRFNP